MEPISNVFRPLLLASLLSGVPTLASRLDRQETSQGRGIAP
jgi:hypothetical protein